MFRTVIKSRQHLLASLLGVAVLGQIQSSIAGSPAFLGEYALKRPVRTGSFSTPIDLTVRLANTSGTAFDSVVLSLQSAPTVAAHQGFRETPPMIAGSARTFHGSFIVPTEDAIRWSLGKGPGPTFLITGRDSAGNPVSQRLEMRTSFASLP